MKILAFDTATAGCSVALLINGEILERFEVALQRHAELILPMIDNLLNSAGITLKQLDAIAVGQGPGSFMGLRIAVGVAQGLAFGADLPVIPISSLQTLAQTAYRQTQHPHIIAGWDARMQAIYWGIYSLGENQLMMPVVPDALIEPQDLIIPEGNDWLLTGNAWLAYRQQLTPVLKSYRQITDIYPQARAMIDIAAVLFQQGQVRNALQIEPIYLRDQVAHIKKG